MDRQTRRSLIILAAGLVGVALGYVLRSAFNEPVDEDGLPEAEVDELRSIMAPSVIGSVAVSLRLGSMLPVGDDDVVVHAAVAAATGAALSYFAHGLGRMAPRLAALLR